MAKQTIDLVELYRQEPLEACRLALERTRDIDSDKRLEAISKLIGGHGEEAIRTENWRNGYWGDILGGYVNMGDTYAPTVLQIRSDRPFSRGKDACSFHVNTLGDYVEKNGQKKKII